MISHYSTLFDQYIAQLYSEVETFPEVRLWHTQGSIANSAGNLAMHLCGNLRFFIGGTLGNTGYIRHRDEEFVSRISRTELLSLIATTRSEVEKSFASLDPEVLDRVQRFDLRSLPEPVSTAYFLSHLAAHLGYHVGQINYFRRIISE